MSGAFKRSGRGLVSLLHALSLLCLLSGAVAGAEADPAWERLGPLAIKQCEPVQLVRNPLQQARQVSAPKSVPGRTRREFVQRLKRQLEEQVRGVVRVEGRCLLLLGGRVCQVGQELPLSAGGAGPSPVVEVRIKSMDAGRLVLLLSEPEAEDSACEEWVYPLSEFLTKK